MYSPFAAAIAYIPRFLLLGIWVATAVLAFSNYAKDPRKSIFVLIAIAIHIINLLSSWGISFIVPLIDTNGVSVGTIIMYFGIIQNVLSVIAWAFLLAALFFVPQAPAPTVTGNDR